MVPGFRVNQYPLVRVIPGLSANLTLGLLHVCPSTARNRRQAPMDFRLPNRRPDRSKRVRERSANFCGGSAVVAIASAQARLQLLAVTSAQTESNSIMEQHFVLAIFVKL
jgi:hypothetical protein